MAYWKVKTSEKYAPKWISGNCGELTEDKRGQGQYGKSYINIFTADEYSRIYRDGHRQAQGTAS